MANDAAVVPDDFFFGLEIAAAAFSVAGTAVETMGAYTQAKQAKHIAEANARQASADANIAAARSQVIGARSNVDAARATIARIEADIRDSDLKAPRGGRIQYRVAQPGEVVAGGGRVMNLVDLTDVYMTFFLPETVAGRVRIGSDSSGRAARMHGMGFVFPEALPAPALRDWNGPDSHRRMIPMHIEVYPRVSLFVQGLAHEGSQHSEDGEGRCLTQGNVQRR